MCESCRGSELEALGLYIYGTRWKSALARACGVTARSVHRWVDQASCPRPVHCRRIAELAAARHHHLAVTAELNYRAIVAGVTSSTMLDALLRLFFWLHATPGAAVQVATEFISPIV